MKKTRWFMFFLMSTFVAHGQLAWAGCDIKITASNSHPREAKYHDVFFEGPGSSSYVKIKGGTWKKIWKYGTIRVQSDSTETFTYKAQFGCDVKRRYSFNIKCYWVDGWKYAQFYYPAENDWTQETHIDLGDVWGKYCE